MSFLIQGGTWPGFIVAAFPELTHQKDNLGLLLKSLVLRPLLMQLKKETLYDFVENFAGRAMISLHLLKLGFHGKRLDKRYSEDDAYDATTTTGIRQIGYLVGLLRNFFYIVC